jgi:hypothetical protein
MAYENPLPGFFFAGDQKNVPQSLRQKIALAMLMQKRAYPKTFGEGLAAIGDAIGDRYGIMGIEKDAAAAEVAGQKARDEYSGTTPPAVKGASYAPTDSVEPGAPQSPDQPPALATMQQQHPDMLAQQKQPLVTTPPAQQPSPTMFSPPAATPPTMGQQPPPPGMLVDPAQANSIDNAGLADRTFARQRGIAGIESGGAKNPYALLGSVTRTGDRAYGKYQMMGANIPEWTQAALGQSMTPQQFLANPQAQDAVFNHRFGQYADKYGEQGAAKAWYAGERGMQNPNATDMHGRLTVAGYGQDYARRAGAPDPRAAATAALVAQQAPPAGLPPEITGGASQPDQRLAFNGAQPPAPPQQVRAAPPPPQAQIQQAPPPGQPQQGPGPGYVLTLPPEPTPPPTMTPGMQRIQNIIRNTPPSQRESVTEALKEPYAQEQAQLAQQNAVYQDKLKSRHDLIKLQEEQRQKAASDAANVAHTNQQTNTGNIIEMPDGNKYRQDASGKLHPIQIEGVTNDPSKPPTPKMTAEQSKSQKFHGWTSLAEEQMGGKEKLLADGLQQELAGKVPFVGNKLQASEYRRVRGAAERFVQGFLRDISGAVISPEEMVKHQQTFLPRYGDDARAIADKKAAREQIINGLYASAGPGQKISDWETERRHTARAAQETKLNEEMSGKDKAKTYEKNGVFRKWNGSSWEEF